MISKLDSFLASNTNFKSSLCSRYAWFCLCLLQTKWQLTSSWVGTHRTVAHCKFCLVCLFLCHNPNIRQPWSSYKLQFPSSPSPMWKRGSTPSKLVAMLVLTVYSYGMAMAVSSGLYTWKLILNVLFKNLILSVKYQSIIFIKQTHRVPTTLKCNFLI